MPLAVELSRRTDGRWTAARHHDPTSFGEAAPDAATTELAVTRARGPQTDGDWEAMTAYDPAFEDASTRFFEIDPGPRPAYERLMDDDVTDDAVGNGGGPVYEFAPDTAAGGAFERPGPVDPPDRLSDPGPVAGKGYEAVYGEPVGAPDEVEVDVDELATGAAARRNAIEWAVVLVAAVLLALVLRALVLQAFYIPSPSMEDTLLIQDRVLVNKLSYRFGDVGRGDIVVFHRTEAEIASAGPSQPKDVIKRVIALGGETIEIRENTVYINDQELVEPYLDPGLVMPDFGPLTVPEGFLFVMGDNRNLSSDSRGELGPIAEDRVVGRAFVLFWPVNRLGRL